MSDFHETLTGKAVGHLLTGLGLIVGSFVIYGLVSGLDGDDRDYTRADWAIIIAYAFALRVAYHLGLGMGKDEHKRK